MWGKQGLLRRFIRWLKEKDEVNYEPWGMWISVETIERCKKVRAQSERIQAIWNKYAVK